MLPLFRTPSSTLLFIPLTYPSLFFLGGGIRRSTVHWWRSSIFTFVQHLQCSYCLFEEDNRKINMMPRRELHDGHSAHFTWSLYKSLKNMYSASPFSNKGTEAPEVQVICSWSHSYYVSWWLFTNKSVWLSWHFST